MKTLFKWAILCSFTLGLNAFAGPPEGMVKQMIPFPAMCLPATVEQHHVNVLLTGFAGGSETKGSSTRYFEMPPVFPGSRTLFFTNL